MGIGIYDELFALHTVKKALSGPFVLKPNSLGQPGLDCVGAVFSFPLFQRFVVAAFGLDDFAGVRIFVDIHLTWFTCADIGFGGWNTTTRLRIKQADHVLQAVTVLSKQNA